MAQGVQLEVPDAAEIRPTAQATQLAWPATFWYCPDPQVMHAIIPEFGAYQPVAQFMQTVDAPVVDEYLPVAQLMQLVDAAAPVVVRYWPAAHGVQAVAPVAAAYRPGAQAPQLVDTWDPVAVTKSPVAQGVHATVPKLVAY